MRGVLAAFIALLVAACQEPAPAPTETPGPADTQAAPVPEPPPRAPVLNLARAGFGEMPGWAGADPRPAFDAFERSCRVFERRDPGAALGPDPRFGRIGDWLAACATLGIRPTDAGAARSLIEAAFQPWTVTADDDPEGLFTGYFEPELRGSRRRSDRFSVPLLQRPADLVAVELGGFRDSLKGERIAGRIEGNRLVPYETRAEIDAGALGDRARPLVWVDDPIDAFFLHIQGSGKVALDDGSAIRVGYAGQNGHVYFAIGRELIRREVLTRETVSLQTIRAWMEANPAEAEPLMHLNPSYIFFRELDRGGPVGAQNVVLTPEASLAIDRSLLPLGAPMWVDVQDPLALETRWRRLMIAQDTGGAIRGPVRGDVFWGAGAGAEARAGVMKSRGRYWLLLPAGVDPTAGSG